MAGPQERDGVVIGVDVGGTKVAAGLVHCSGAVLRRVRVSMLAGGTPQDGFAAVKSAIDALLAGAAPPALGGIGICSPGPLDPRAGIVINPPNLPCWRNFPLAAETARAYALPVCLDNDANAAGLAEARWGAGAGFGNVFYLTIGTGIGTGVIVDQQVYHGRTGGKRGCIEALASGPAIARRAQSKLRETRRHSQLRELTAGQIDALTTEMVGRADAAGDPLAHEVVLDTIVVLSVWLSNIIDLLEPEVIVVGGGAAALLEPYFDDIRAQVADICVNSRALEIPLLPARYGADAGIAGGAALCAPWRQPAASNPDPSAAVS